MVNGRRSRLIVGAAAAAPISPIESRSQTHNIQAMPLDDDTSQARLTVGSLNRSQEMTRAKRRHDPARS